MDVYSANKWTVVIFVRTKLINELINRSGAIYGSELTRLKGFQAHHRMNSHNHNDNVGSVTVFINRKRNIQVMMLFHR